MYSTATFNAWDSVLQNTVIRINKHLNDDNLDAISLEWQAYDMYKQAVWKI